MSLIDCPECGKRISDQASNCPDCGYPVTIDPHQAVTPVDIQTIEKTLKRYKAITAVAVVIMFIGISWSFATCGQIGETTQGWVGPILGVIGLVIYFVNRVTIWWQHE